MSCERGTFLISVENSEMYSIQNTEIISAFGIFTDNMGNENVGNNFTFLVKSVNATSILNSVKYHTAAKFAEFDFIILRVTFLIPNFDAKFDDDTRSIFDDRNISSAFLTHLSLSSDSSITVISSAFSTLQCAIHTEFTEITEIFVNYSSSKKAKDLNVEKNNNKNYLNDGKKNDNYSTDKRRNDTDIDENNVENDDSDKSEFGLKVSGNSTDPEPMRFLIDSEAILGFEGKTVFLGGNIRMVKGSYDACNFIEINVILNDNQNYGSVLIDENISKENNDSRSNDENFISDSLIKIVQINGNLKISGSFEAVEKLVKTLQFLPGGNAHHEKSIIFKFGYLTNGNTMQYNYDKMTVFIMPTNRNLKVLSNFTDVTLSMNSTHVMNFGDVRVLPNIDSNSGKKIYKILDENEEVTKNEISRTLFSVSDSNILPDLSGFPCEMTVLLSVTEGSLIFTPTSDLSLLLLGGGEFSMAPVTYPLNSDRETNYFDSLSNDYLKKDADTDITNISNYVHHQLNKKDKSQIKEGMKNKNKNKNELGIKSYNNIGNEYDDSRTQNNIVTDHSSAYVFSGNQAIINSALSAIKYVPPSKNTVVIINLKIKNKNTLFSEISSNTINLTVQNDGNISPVIMTVSPQLTVLENTEFVSLASMSFSLLKTKEIDIANNVKEQTFVLNVTTYSHIALTEYSIANNRHNFSTQIMIGNRETDHQKLKITNPTPISSSVSFYSVSIEGKLDNIIRYVEGTFLTIPKHFHGFVETIFEIKIRHKESGNLKSTESVRTFLTVSPKNNPPTFQFHGNSSFNPTNTKDRHIHGNEGESVMFPILVEDIDFSFLSFVNSDICQKDKKHCSITLNASCENCYFTYVENTHVQTFYTTSENFGNLTEIGENSYFEVNSKFSFFSFEGNPDEINEELKNILVWGKIGNDLQIISDCGDYDYNNSNCSALYNGNDECNASVNNNTVTVNAGTDEINTNCTYTESVIQITINDFGIYGLGEEYCVSENVTFFVISKNTEITEKPASQLNEIEQNNLKNNGIIRKINVIASKVEVSMDENSVLVVPEIEITETTVSQNTADEGIVTSILFLFLFLSFRVCYI